MCLKQYRHTYLKEVPIWTPIREVSIQKQIAKGLVKFMTSEGPVISSVGKKVNILATVILKSLQLKEKNMLVTSFHLD